MSRFDSWLGDQVPTTEPGIHAKHLFRTQVDKGSTPLLSSRRSPTPILGSAVVARFPAQITRRSLKFSLLVVVDSTRCSTKAIAQVRFLARRPERVSTRTSYLRPDGTGPSFRRSLPGFDSRRRCHPRTRERVSIVHPYVPTRQCADNALTIIPVELARAVILRELDGLMVNQYPHAQLGRSQKFEQTRARGAVVQKSQRGGVVTLPAS